MRKPKLTLTLKVIISIVIVEFLIMFFLDKIPLTKNLSSLSIAVTDTLILGVIVIFIIKYSLRPLNDILTTLKKIGEGNLNFKLKIKKQDELGTIAQYINQMSEQLKTSYGKIQEKESLLTTITQGVAEEIMLIDENYKILWANKHAIQTSGLKPEQVIGNYCYKVSHHLETPCQAPIHSCPIRSSLTDEKTVKVTHKHLTKNNKTTYVEISVYPIKLGAEKKNKAFIHISRDITERMQMLRELEKNKEEIEKYSHQLEKIVEKRTKKLSEANEQLKKTQAQLIQTGKMAAIGQLASGVSHEINNPMTVILNNVLILKMLLKKPAGTSETDIKETLKNIETAITTCKETTQSLLEFSHVSTGDLEDISISEVFKKIFTLIELEMKLSNIIIQKDFPPDLPLIKGDRQFLQQAFFNIIANCHWAIREKSQNNGGTISVKTSYNKNTHTISIIISDTGIGIKKENIHRIFEAFYTTKDIGSGTGLGLYLAYNIIKNHEGTIEAESQPDKGSTFKITLPVISADWQPQLD